MMNKNKSKIDKPPFIKFGPGEYKEFLEIQSDLVCVMKKDGQILYANSSYCNFFHRSIQEITKMTIFNLIPENIHAEIRTYINTLTPQNPKANYIHPVITGDGNFSYQQWIDHAVFEASGEIKYIQSVGRDISPAIKMEENLKSAKQFLEAIYDGVNFPIWVTDIDNDGNLRWIHNNKADQENTGYNLCSEKGIEFEELYPEEAATFYRNLCKKVFATKNNISFEEFIPTKNKGKRWFYNTLTPIFDENGKMCKIIGSGIDITHIKQALMQQEFLTNIAQEVNQINQFDADIRQILEKCGTFSLLDEIQICFHYQNPQTKEVYYWQKNGIFTRNQCFFSQFAQCPLFIQTKSISFKSADEFKQIAGEQFASFSAQSGIIIPFKRQHQIVGLMFFFKHTPYAWQKSDLNVAELIAALVLSAYEREQNYQQKIKLERKNQANLELIEKATRLATVGTMAAGITHEINQPLNAIRVLSESLLYWEDFKGGRLPGFVRDYLTDITISVQRIQQIIGEMRRFQTAMNTEKELFPLTEAIAEALKIIDIQIKERQIELSVNQPYQFQLKGSKINFIQIILNLIMNAIESFDSEPPDLKTIQIRCAKENSTFRITIEDNGCGLAGDPEKIFDPFFTTKPNLSHMGLGLPITRILISKFEGTLSVENRQPRGVISTILIPHSN